MLNIAINKKLKKGLQQQWNRLVKSKNYFSPKNIDELKEINLINNPSIKLNGKEYFFKEDIVSVLNEFVNKIYDIGNINKFVTYNTLYHKVIKTITEIGFNKKEKVNFDDIFRELINQIEQDINKYEFFWRIEGIELIDHSTFNFNDSILFIFSQNKFDYIKKFLSKVNPSFDNIVETKVNNQFLNKVCIKTTSSANYNYARKDSLKKANNIINILRFIFCFYYPEYISYNRFKINLVSDFSLENNDSIGININKKSVILNFNSKMSLKQNFKIHKDLINDFNKFYFLEELISVLNKPKNKKTPLEIAISNAIYWISEAQNTDKAHIAFINFWTSIESLTYNTNNSEDEGSTQAIKKNTSILLAHGGYGFYSTNEYFDLKSRINRLYDKRSKIIHEGELENLNSNDLAEICEYSTRLTLEILGLSILEIKTLNEIEENVKRIHNIYIENDK